MGLGRRSEHTPRLVSRRLMPLAAALGALLFVACFEDPVEEDLYLCFDGADYLMVRLDVVLHQDTDDENAAFAARADEVRRSLQEGYGEWHDRFDRMGETGLDGMSMRRADGRLERYRRWAYLEGSGRAGRERPALTR